jgi:imidazolonepropionase-like amidohydrolase
MTYGLRALLAATALTCLTPLAALAQAPAKPADHWVVIHAGSLLAEVGQPVKTNATLVIKNDRIEAIRDGFVAPDASMPNAQVIELKDKFVMPGMIDAHVHTAFMGGLAGALVNARTQVMGGATTVRDAGSEPTMIFPLRDAIAQGLAVGPRIMASGMPISTTGGHGDFRNGDFAKSLEPPEFQGGICDGPEECLKATRRQIQLGADQVKMIATAGVVDNSYTGLDQQFSTPEMEAIVTAAHLMKRKVMAHAIGTEGVKAAVRAGVDSIEHANDLDAEGAQMMKAKGTYLVATLMAPYDVLRRVRDPKIAGMFPISENTKRKVLAMAEAQPGGLGRQVKIAMKAGVKMGAGTDFGGTIGEEVGLLVTDGGMSPEAALRAATTSNADLLGLSSEIGSLAAGKSADVIAVDANPLKDIKTLAKPSFVMARGRVFKEAGASVLP